ncbi:MAG: hypothetical protein KBB21_17225 [Nannocystaceae bacterium]|nr:hypothetical protein [Nannocystaceae bacterium]
MIVATSLGCSAAGTGSGASASGASVGSAGGGTAAETEAGAEGASAWDETTSTGGEGSDSDGASSGDASTGAEMSGGGSSSGMGDSSSGGPADPAVDMWSPCQTDSDCASSVCVVLTAGGQILGGYCSVTPCGNAPQDCGQPPAGTASPICLDIMDQVGQQHSVCGLDCSGGGSCPPGLACVAEVGSICV